MFLQKKSNFDGRAATPYSSCRPSAEGVCRVFAWLIIFESVRVQEALVQADMDVA